MHTENVFKWVTSEISLPSVMFVNLILCDVCACFGNINAMIDQRVGLRLVIVSVGVQEAFIVTNGSLPLFTGPHTHRENNIQHISFLKTELFNVCAQVCLNIPNSKDFIYSVLT